MFKVTSAEQKMERMQTFCKVSPVHFECFLKFIKSCNLYQRCWMLGMPNKHKS